MAFSVSVRDAAAKTISSTDSPEAASEEAAAEPATEETELLEPPQAVRAADADAMPAAHRKPRREIWVFMVLSPYVVLIDLSFTASPAGRGL